MRVLARWAMSGLVAVLVHTRVAELFAISPTRTLTEGKATELPTFVIGAVCYLGRLSLALVLANLDTTSMVSGAEASIVSGRLFATRYVTLMSRTVFGAIAPRRAMRISACVE